MSVAAPFPARDRMTTQAGLVALSWLNWFTSLQTDVGNAPARLKSVTLTAQGASIGATAIPVGSLASGLYRVSYLARITTPATTSSSLTVTLGFTNGGVACSLSGAAMTGNTTSTVQTGSHMVAIDRASPVTYATTYASVGATPMAYSLWVVLEEVDA